MIIYLAGGITGNLAPYWKEYMKIYLASPSSRSELKEAMKIFLAGNLKHCKSYYKNSMETAIYILESFYYINRIDWIIKLIPQFKGFMLDSGAFTYMQGNGDKMDFDRYVEQYADFINRNNIELFFELDVDSIVGLKEVERLRVKLERLTGKQCIPVWHKSRGKDNWLQTIQEYPYVALGGIVTKTSINKQDFKYLPWFIETAHEAGAKIHGLGFTQTTLLNKYRFDSVDSTAWLYGNRGGFLYMFNGTGIDKIDKPNGTRLKSREVAVHNFNEWVKFQKYAEKNL